MSVADLLATAYDLRWAARELAAMGSEPEAILEVLDGAECADRRAEAEIERQAKAFEGGL